MVAIDLYRLESNVDNVYLYVELDDDKDISLTTYKGYGINNLKREGRYNG